MKGTYPFSILVEDYENSSKDYTDNEACPFFQAFKRQFPELIPYSVGTERVSYYKKHFFNLFKLPRQAFVKNKFGAKEYLELEKGIEHHTTITF